MAWTKASSQGGEFRNTTRFRSFGQLTTVQYLLHMHKKASILDMFLALRPITSPGKLHRHQFV